MQEPVHSQPVEEEFSFKKNLLERKNDFRYLRSFLKLYIVVAIAGVIFGAFAAWLWPITYTARLTFVVEEAKSGGGSLVSALAGQFGFDVGDINNKGGVLGGDNVLELLKSQKIIKNALLKPLDKTGASTLADKYAEAYKMQENWKKYTGSTPITFPVNTSTYTRLQDSLLLDIIKRIQENNLSVNKPDKKLGFFALTATTKNEKLSQLLCYELIKQATDFYIKTKTKKIKTNVDKLQRRSDSLATLLNRKTYSASVANKILLDANPAYPTTNVGTELRERDKMVLSTIYSEVVKNLEVSKTMLMQETPTFQIVDEPELPLKKNELRYLKGMILFAMGFIVLLSIVLLLLKKS